MSNQKVAEATIPGWSGPFFPAAMEHIQKRYGYATVRFNDMLFDDVADQLNAGKVLNLPVTSDVKSRFKTPWSHGIEFKRHGHTGRALFPMATDSARTDGSFATRHIALYFKGEAPGPREIDLIGRELADDFIRSYHELYDRK